MKNFLFLLCVISGCVASFAQDLNAYKYVVVPAEFEILKEPNQYQLNDLTKFLFEKYGFETYMEGEEGELPEEVGNSRCEALFANVLDNSGLFNTKLTVVLKDCNNRQVFVSEEGFSKEKEYKTAFHAALRDAFKSIEALNYSYMPKAMAERQVQNKPVPTEPTSTIEKEVVQEGKVEKNESLKEKKVASGNELGFTYDSSSYILRKTENGYNFFEKGMAQPFAALIKSSGSDTFIYSSITSKGMASFDEEGNLVVEILQANTNTLERTIYLKNN